MWKPWAVQFTNDDKVLYSSGWDAAIRRWDVATGKELPLPVGMRASETVALSADGRHVAFRDGAGDVRVLDSRTGQQRHKLPSGGAEAILFAPDGNRLFAAGSVDDDIQVRIWDLVEEHATHTWRWPRGDDPHSGIEELATDNAGRYLAAVSFRQGMASLWRTDSGKKLSDCPHRAVYGLAMSPDGTTLVTVGWDKTIKAWKAEIGELLQSVNVEEAVDDPQFAAGDARMYGVRFSPDGKRIAACHMDGHVSVWDATQPNDLKPIFQFTTGIQPAVRRSRRSRRRPHRPESSPAPARPSRRTLSARGCRGRHPP